MPLTPRSAFQISHLTDHIFRTTYYNPLYIRDVILLGPDGPIGRSLRIRGERIVAIDAPPRKNDRVIDGQGRLLLPGLINAHDHLELNTFRRLKYRVTYTHSRQWIEDIEDRFGSDPGLVEPREQPLADRIWVGVLKNMLSGVTTVCHHNPLHKSLRRSQPIRVVKNYGFCHSLFRGEDTMTSYLKTKPDWPWIIHLAEGVDAEAAAEFDRLDRLGALQRNTVLVHGVGLTANQRQALIERGGGLIWCPGSNNFLFGQTACVQELAQSGKLALASDSRLSGEFDLLTELRVAGNTGQLTPQCLFQSVTGNAARLLRLQEKGLGQIAVGGVADFLMLAPPQTTDYFSNLLDLRRGQIELVMLGGKPLVGSPELQSLFSATQTKFTPVWVDEIRKLMSAALAARLKKFSVQEPGLVLK